MANDKPVIVTVTVNNNNSNQQEQKQEQPVQKPPVQKPPVQKPPVRQPPIINGLNPFIGCGTIFLLFFVIGFAGIIIESDETFEWQGGAFIAIVIGVVAIIFGVFQYMGAKK